MIPRYFYGDNRARTCDPMRVMHVLSQLSYASVHYSTTNPENCKGKFPKPGKLLAIDIKNKKDYDKRKRAAAESLPAGKEKGIMKAAVTYENGQVFQHFGHCSQFKFYEGENGQIRSSQVVETGGSGHGALAGFLKEHGADALICGGIGMGARMALQEAGIALYPGVSGSADEAAAALFAGSLSYDPDASCSHHHEEGHDCGHHDGGCGEDKHGCPGSR